MGPGWLTRGWFFLFEQLWWAELQRVSGGVGPRAEHLQAEVAAD